MLLITLAAAAFRRLRRRRRSGPQLLPVNTAADRPVRCVLSGDERLTGAARLMLARLNTVAACDLAFADSWNDALAGAADQLTARIAGARMAGTAVGLVRGRASVPVPRGHDPQLVQAAFTLAVAGEVNRRIEAMASPGAFG